MGKQFFLAFVLIIIGISGCKKEAVSINCQKLQADMASNAKEGVKTTIEELIDRLPSKRYNEANIQALVDQLKSQCSLSARILCFDCIKTLPSQTELEISFPMQGNIVRKIIDITYSGNNRMVFGNMHD